MSKTCLLQKEDKIIYICISNSSGGSWKLIGNY